MPPPRISRVFGAVNIGSFRISAMIAGLSDTGEMMVLGSGHRAAQGIRRGYVTDMAAATYAVRDAVERAEKMANVSVSSVWIGCSGAGLTSQIAQVEVDIGGRRIESDDVDQLLYAARDVVQPDGRTVLHAQPAHYTLDGANGVADPKGLHAERLGVDIHVMLADGAPIRNITEAVQNAHLEVEAVVASPVAAGHACLTPEERDLGRGAGRNGRGSDQCFGACLGHAGRPRLDPDGLGRYHRRDCLRIRYPPLSGRAAEMRQWLGDRQPGGSPRDDPGQCARRRSQRSACPPCRRQEPHSARRTDFGDHQPAGRTHGGYFQGLEGAGLYRTARPAGGADRRRRGAGRPRRLCPGRARADRCGSALRRALRALPKATQRPDLRRWRGWCSMLRPIRSISDRSGLATNPPCVTAVLAWSIGSIVP